MAKILGKNPFHYEKERDSFLSELKQFHACRGWVLSSPLFTTDFLLFIRIPIDHFTHNRIQESLTDKITCVLGHPFAVSPP